MQERGRQIASNSVTAAAIAALGVAQSLYDARTDQAAHSASQDAYRALIAAVERSTTRRNEEFRKAESEARLACTEQIRVIRDLCR